MTLLRTLPALLVTLAACERAVSVHIRGGDRPPDPDYLVLASPASEISVTSFRIVLRNLRLQSEPTDGHFDTPGIEFIGPGTYFVDLPGSALAGGTFTELISKFHLDPKGLYEMDIDLAPVSTDDVKAQPALAPMLGKTFVIEGTDAQGAPFVIESSMERVLVREGVFRIGLNNNNLDLNVARNTWFVGADGGVLRPGDAAVRAQIEENVAASMDAYEDDDMDGIPDPLG